MFGCALSMYPRRGNHALGVESAWSASLIRHLRAELLFMSVAINARAVES